MAEAPRVYVDSPIYLNVMLRETLLWPSSLKLLLAGERGDVHLIASHLVIAEVGKYRGNAALRHEAWWA